MSKMAVIYWSMTGNTQAMAEAIADGAREAGAQADLFSVDQVTVDQALEYDKLALGCPAMGAEVLEEAEFEPFFTALEGRLGGKRVALFGSYGCGDGQWMREWCSRCQAAGANLYDEEGLMANESPNEEAREACRELGRKLAAW